MIINGYYFTSEEIKDFFKIMAYVVSVIVTAILFKDLIKRENRSIKFSDIFLILCPFLNTVLCFIYLIAVVFIVSVKGVKKVKEVVK